MRDSDAEGSPSRSPQQAARKVEEVGGCGCEGVDVPSLLTLRPLVAVEANIASVRVLEKVGMHAVGRGADETFLGVPSHYKRYEILRPS